MERNHDISAGVLELAALPSIDKEQWIPLVQESDVLLVGGGDPLYLCYWMRQSGVAELLPSLHETVYVGLSAGSMVMAPYSGEAFAGWPRLFIGGEVQLDIVEPAYSCQRVCVYLFPMGKDVT